VKQRSAFFVLGGLLVALLVAGLVSRFASSEPDGLDSSLLQGCTVNDAGEITGGTCPALTERDHELADGPMTDYTVKGVEDEKLSTGLAGVIGVLITFAVAGGAFWLVRRRSPDGTADESTVDEPTPTREPV
jgi:cobalt/nickel transport protein